MLTRDRLQELLRFGVATLISASLTLGLPIVLHEGLAVEERRAVAIAVVIAFVVNFLTTRYYVFKSSGKAGDELWRFLGTSLAFRLAEYGLFLLLFSLGLVYYLAQFIVLALSFVMKFIVQRRFVYRQPGGGP
jgi:putative flippase GtrA